MPTRRMRLFGAQGYGNPTDRPGAIPRRVVVREQSSFQTTQLQEPFLELIATSMCPGNAAGGVGFCLSRTRRRQLRFRRGEAGNDGYPFTGQRLVSQRGCVSRHRSQQAVQNATQSRVAHVVGRVRRVFQAQPLIARPVGEVNRGRQFVALLQQRQQLLRRELGGRVAEAGK